jgi:Zn finger protein HypA/HybF involved in hydrogenase expression
MHEVALMQGMVAEIVRRAEAAQARRITRVALRLEAAGHMTEAAARHHAAPVGSIRAASSAVGQPVICH